MKQVTIKAFDSYCACNDHGPRFRTPLPIYINTIVVKKVSGKRNKYFLFSNE